MSANHVRQSYLRQTVTTCRSNRLMRMAHARLPCLHAFRRASSKAVSLRWDFGDFVDEVMDIEADDGGQIEKLDQVDTPFTTLDV